MLKKFPLILLTTAFFAGCHTIVPTTSIYDNEMTCSEIHQEIVKTEALQKDISDTCGLSTRNAVGLVLFWPSVVINETTGLQAQNAAKNRIEHLNNLYVKNQCRNCLIDPSALNENPLS